MAYITNHSYLDNPTFRGMRWNLLNAFDDLYILDLHGSAKKKETTPDGKADVNVFDIQQGVAIIVAVKKKDGKDTKKPLANVYHADVWGSRDFKYEFLEEHNLKKIQWSKLEPSKSTYLFIPRDETLLKEYNQGFSVTNLFIDNSLGFLTKRDDLTVDFYKEALIEKIKIFFNPNISTDEACKAFGLVISDKDKWNAPILRKNYNAEKIIKSIIACTYRPFDTRYVAYDEAIIARANKRVLSDIKKDNFAFIIGRQGQAVGSGEWNLIFCTNNISDQNVYYRGGGTVFPLHNNGLPNLDPKIYAAFKKIVPDVTPESLFDYIYAVLHCPTYRTRYAEFLKSDFPRIPYPTAKKTFHDLAKKGGVLRELHLMESPLLDDITTTYPMAGDHVVKKLRYDAGKVYINETQYFGGVPDDAWNFYIGGYQPAQKWLKDRKDRKLTPDDIKHYQRIIVALTQTHKMMQDIEMEF